MTGTGWQRRGMAALLAAVVVTGAAVVWRVAEPVPAPVPAPAVDWQKLATAPDLRRPHPLPERVGLDNSTVPGRRLEQYELGPLAVVTRPGSAPTDGGRTIVLHRDRIELLDGAAVVRRIRFDARAAVPLETVVGA